MFKSLELLTCCSMVIPGSRGGSGDVFVCHGLMSVLLLNLRVDVSGSGSAFVSHKLMFILLLYLTVDCGSAFVSHKLMSMRLLYQRVDVSGDIQ
jgi:hypothetical protein